MPKSKPTILESTLSSLTTRYIHLRTTIGHRTILENIVRVYCPTKTEILLNQLSGSIATHSGTLIEKCCSKKMTLAITADDLCFWGAVNFGMVIGMMLLKSGLLEWIGEGYFCIVYPMMVSYRAVEDGDLDVGSDMLTYWILFGGLGRLIDTLLPLRVFFPRIHTPLKCLSAFCLYHPKIQGSRVLNRLVVKPFLLPFLGIGKQIPEIEKLVTLKEQSFALNIPKNEMSVIAEERSEAESDETSVSQNKLGLSDNSSEFSFVDVSTVEAQVKESKPESVDMLRTVVDSETKFQKEAPVETKKKPTTDEVTAPEMIGVEKSETEDVVEQPLIEEKEIDDSDTVDKDDSTVGVETEEEVSVIEAAAAEEKLYDSSTTNETTPDKDDVRSETKVEMTKEDGGDAAETLERLQKKKETELDSRQAVEILDSLQKKNETDSHHVVTDSED